MKHLKTLGIVGLGVITLTGCHLGRTLLYNFADIKDYKRMPVRKIENTSGQTFTFGTKTGNFTPPEATNIKGETIALDQLLESSKTRAFLIIKNDEILFEKYYKGYDQESIVPSFSMAKSFTSALIGCALQDGYIKSENELITNYIPEMKGNGMDSVTIKHLLEMTSGLKFNENYFNPFADAGKFYYGKNLRSKTAHLKGNGKPGKQFKYLSGNTQVLGLVLERALKNKSLSAYLQEKIWTPLGMEFDASWTIDNKQDGIEKTFCCINARARDYAKFGRLYLNKGNWNGKQIIPKEWVEKSTKIDESNGSMWFYENQWWIPSKDGDFLARGFLGQYIYVNPKKNLILVRLGKNEGKVNWPKFFTEYARKL